MKHYSKYNLVFVIIIDSTLSWKQHIDNIIPKINKACFAIRFVNPYMTTEILKTLFYQIFIQS